MKKVIFWIKSLSNLPLIVIGACASLILIGINIILNSGSGELISIARDIPIMSIRANYIIPTILFLMHALLQFDYAKNGLDDSEKRVLNTIMGVALILYGYFCWQYISLIYLDSTLENGYYIVKNGTQILARMSSYRVEDSTFKLVIALAIDYVATAVAVKALADPSTSKSSTGPAPGPVPTGGSTPPPGASGSGGSSGPSTAGTRYIASVGGQINNEVNVPRLDTFTKPQLETLRFRIEKLKNPPSGVTLTAAEKVECEDKVKEALAKIDEEIAKKP